jgi:hypothetical protein
MHLVDIINLAFSVQCDDCFASSFSPITAAWATQGYWMQATIIEYLGGSGLSTIAALLYALAVGAGIVGYTLGSPPRNYLWYFVGPALFHFLLFTTEPAKGVVWQMGVNGNGGPIFGNQAEVWKLAEVGLVNQENILRRGVQVSRAGEPTQMAEVSTVFLTVDALFSDLIQGLVGLLGTKEMMANRAAGADTNIPDVDTFEDFAAADFYRISNSKWGMLENITYASVKDIKMLKSLAIFFGSDCGDTLVKQIDQAKFTAATRARSGQLPESIFKSTGPQDYKQLKEVMAAQGTTISPALKQMFPVTSCAGTVNSLTCFSDLTQSASDYLNDDENEYISCDNYLSYMIEGMRWESGNAYYQLINSAPQTMAPKYVLFNLFYGWGIRRLTNGVPTGRPLNAHDELIKYTPNLILVHILRNMFEFTSVTPDQKFTPADDMINLTQYQQRNISSKTKFVEVYSWALMIPYIQGLVLYFLSIAYPVVCVAMIMPNLYKLPLTWVKFWFWAKSWDLGFAIVMAIDKSVWAMMSNSPKSQTVLGYIGELSDTKYHPITITVSCDNPLPGSPAGRGCPDAIITDTAGIGADPFVDYLMPIFDKAMILSKNLELDLANSYYIYIMAALYFAVPAVTGQLVGSIGSLAGGAMDKFTDVKSAANAGVQSDKNQRLNAYSQLSGQEKSFSTQRNPGGGGADFGGKAFSDNQMKGGANGAGAPLARNGAGNGAGVGAGNGAGGGAGGGPGSNRVAGGGGAAGSGGGAAGGGGVGLGSSFAGALAAGVTNGAIGGRTTGAGLNRSGLPGTTGSPNASSNGQAGQQQDAQAQNAIAGANIGQSVGAAMMPGGAIPGRIAGAAIGAMMGGGVASSTGSQAQPQPSGATGSTSSAPVQGAAPNKLASPLQGNSSSQGAAKPGSTMNSPSSQPAAQSNSQASQANSAKAAPSSSPSRSALLMAAGAAAGSAASSQPTNAQGGMSGLASSAQSAGQTTSASSTSPSRNAILSGGGAAVSGGTTSSQPANVQSSTSGSASTSTSPSRNAILSGGGGATVSGSTSGSASTSTSPTRSALLSGGGGSTGFASSTSSQPSNGQSSAPSSVSATTSPSRAAFLSSGGGSSVSGSSNVSSAPSYAQSTSQNSGSGFSTSETSSGGGVQLSSTSGGNSASGGNVATTAPSRGAFLAGGTSSRSSSGNSRPSSQGQGNLAINIGNKTSPVRSFRNVS